jgi:penicillin-binding protein 2
MRLHREVKNHSLEQHHYVNRLAFASVVVFVCLGLLLARFIYLQIFKYDYYQTLAESNRISLVPTVPNRGVILDRNGVVLAHNFFVYTLEVTPSKAGNVDDVVNRISQLIEVSAEDKKRFKKLRAQGHDFESVPIRTHLNEIEAAKFAANRYQFPGVEIRSRLF